MMSSSRELAVLLAGHLGVGDGGQHHPQRRGADLVARLDRGGQVGAQTVLESTHAVHCGSLADVTLTRIPARPRVARAGPGRGRWRRAGLASYAAWEARAYTLREVTVPMLPPGHAAAAGAAPQRHPHGTRTSAQAGVAARRWPTSRPTWSSTPATTSPTCARCRSVLDALGGLLDVPGRLRVRLQRLLRADACATRCATCCPTTARATPTPRSCPGASCKEALHRPRAGST